MAVTTKERQPLPRVIKGFERVHRYWDARLQICVAKIVPGEFYVTREDELVTTILGSCVSACVRDRALNIGGMNHFMLPSGTDRPGVLGDATRYGNYAMELLVNEILKQGGTRRNLEVKAFGGGRILSSMTDIGKNNVAFIRDFLQTEGLEIVSEDLGGNQPRRVQYFPASGRARVLRLAALRDINVVEQEETYMKGISGHAVEGDVELF